MKTRKVPTWLGASLILGTFGLLLCLERRRPLRPGEAEPKFTRDARNLAVAGAGALALQIAERPLVERLTVLVERRGWGLVKRARLPVWAETALAVVLLDYTLYLWHVLTHRVPSLWRFHVVHHSDLGLDASTALRFHFAELTVSVAWRVAQVLLIGVSPLSFSVWQTLLLLSIMFHHSNVRLPIDVERRLNRLVVTPRMHGIHHSIVREERDANWSSGLTVWDRLHGTLKLNVPQQEITIGVPAYRVPEEVTLENILEMPFVRQPPTWLTPGGARPERNSLPVAPDHLLA